MSGSLKGTLFITLAAMFWGISGGLASLLMQQGWDPYLISFYRGAIGLVCMLAWFVVHPLRNLRFGWRLVAWSVVAGLGVAGNFTFYFLSISNANVAIAATLMYTAPLFVFLVSFACGLEKPTGKKWASIAAVMVGIVLLTDILRSGTGQVSVWGIACGLLSGLSYALFIFGFRYARAQGPAQAVLSIAFLVLTLLLLAFVDFGQMQKVPFTDDAYGFLLLGLFGAGISFYLYLPGLRRTSPSAASMVAMVEPVTASLFGFVVLGQTLAPLQLTGMAIILITITLLSLQR
ncbi:EamA family transporter [Salinicola sp. MH3R3-1]|uniref:DMT family transporter n=1 Tax=Salinicola sp. MH3R3-1 TaxID=1928762 RepID=UPI00094EE8BC|nr:EamA family transporter [Salinicola sp. MH3R3-1]OLO09720.1 EamA family transporter [Salinicola sp. MH3R3-1]